MVKQSKKRGSRKVRCKRGGSRFAKRLASLVRSERSKRATGSTPAAGSTPATESKGVSTNESNRSRNVNVATRTLKYKKRNSRSKFKRSKKRGFKRSSPSYRHSPLKNVYTAHRAKTKPLTRINLKRLNNLSRYNNTTDLPKRYNKRRTSSLNLNHNN